MAFHSILARFSTTPASKNAYLAADSVMLGSDRMGVNRMSAYNWENNFSSAGSENQHNSDNWLIQNPLPMPTGSGALRLPRVFLQNTLAHCGQIEGD